MTFVIRFLITVCILLSACAFTNAQKTEQDPLERAITELQAGRMEAAFAALDDVIKQHPNNADAYLLRGSLKMNKDPAQALSDFSKVIELKPDSGVAYNQRAILRLTSGDIYGALKDLDAAIRHNFKDDLVYYLRGQLRWQVDERKGALSDLDEAIKLNPGNPRTYASRGELLLELKEQDRALADINYLISWYETDPSARLVPKPSVQNDPKPKSPAGGAPGDGSKGFTVGLEQQTANEAPGAKEMAPTIAGAYANRSVISSDKGNHDAAFTDLNKAIRIDSNNARALQLRAMAYEYKGNLEAALADIIRAVQLEPQNGNALVEHGVILLLMGRDKEAQAIFDVLLKSDQTLWQKRIDERLAAVKKMLPVK